MLKKAWIEVVQRCYDVIGDDDIVFTPILQGIEVKSYSASTGITIRDVINDEKIEKPFSLPSRLLAHNLEMLAGDEFEISFESKPSEKEGDDIQYVVLSDIEAKVSIKSSSRVLPGEDSDIESGKPQDNVVKIDVGEFGLMLDQVSFLMNKKSPGVLFKSDGSRFDVVVTDGYALAITSKNTTSDEASAAVHNVSMSHFMKFIKSLSGDVFISIENDRVIVYSGESIIRLPISLLHFPNYNTVIDKFGDGKYSFDIDSKSMSRVLNRLKGFVSHDTNMAQIVFGDGRIIVKAESSASGIAELFFDVPHDCKGKVLRVNYKQLLSAVEVAGDGVLHISFDKTILLLRTDNNYRCYIVLFDAVKK